MKNDIKYRYNILRNFIYDDNTRKKCRLDNKKYENSFSRKRKLPFYNILLMTLNKQGKNVSFEIRDFELNKKGEKCVNYSDEKIVEIINEQLRVSDICVFSVPTPYFEKKCWATRDL